MSVDNALRRHAERQPSKAAVRTVERSITYVELNASVSCLARHLLERGLRPGDRVAVHWSNSIETVQLLLAAFRAGLVAVPINLRLKAPEIDYIFEDSSPRICFSEPALAAVAEEARRGGDPEVVSQFPALTTNPEPLPEVDAAQPAVILYTSGTTARPKGVTHTHRGLFETALISTSVPIPPDDTLLIITPLMHAFGLNFLLLTALHQSATAVLLRTFDPAAALDLIERFRCTSILGLPAMMQFLVEEQARHPRDVSSVNTAGAGGDTVPAALQRRFHDLFGIELREGYALTESVPVTFNRNEDVRIGSIGTAAPGVTLRLVDSQTHDVPVGETGEILVRSPANCVGYWNDPAATACLFTDGWMHTGDLASRDADGYYWFKGRLKQLIIRGGSNISPQEVEEALYQHSAVLEAGVIGAPHPVYGEVPIAGVTLRAGQTVNEEKLRAHTSELLADYKVPERIFFLAELPKGLTGKVDRRGLRDILIPQPDLLEKRVPVMSEGQATPASGFLFTDEILRDPYPIYRRFLESDQIVHHVNYAGGSWGVFRHAACSSFIRDPRLSAKRIGAAMRTLPQERLAEFGELGRVLRSWLLLIDAPEHGRLRKLMNKGFSPAVVEALRPRIEAIVDRLLEPMRHASESNILQDIAYPLPVAVIAEMFGAPETMHEHFIRWSDAVATFLGSPNKTAVQTQPAQEAVLALVEFFRGAVAERRQKKGSDLISLLLDIAEDGEVLTEEELYAQCVMLLGAGHETTRNLIGNGMYTLLRHPQEMAELRANPELIRTTVEELLRYESPIQLATRVAKEDMEICGVRVRQGELIVFMLGAANRDPLQFKNPDRLDVKRLNNPHLAFGAGEHFCIGNQLARLEGQIAISKMVQQFPRMRLAAQHPEWVPNYGFRGLKALHVAV